MKDVIFCNLSSTLTITPSLLADAGAFNQTMLWEEGLAPRKSLHIELWLVLPPGAELAIVGPPSSSMNYWVSGTELEGVAD